MIILSLDSTTRSGSVALVVGGDDDRIVDERRGDETRTHAERLPGELLALLETHALAPADVDLFAVASGPGLFTGLRVGIATMQGLALAAGRPMVGVSALRALGHLGARGREAGTRVAAWMDAHRRDVFAALFEVTAAAPFAPEQLIDREDATVGDPRAILGDWRARGVGPAVVIGDGAVRYAEAIGEHASAVLPEAPLAGAIGLIALERARRGEAVPPAGIQPVYVRRPDAELARDHALAHRSAHHAGSD